MKRGPYAEPGKLTPGHTSDTSDEKLSTAPNLKWQQHLKDLPRHYAPGEWISFNDRKKYRMAISRARQDGGTIRAIADFLGRSYGFTYRYGYEEHPGNDSRVCQVAEIIRSRIMNGTYKLHEVIPEAKALSTEFKVSKDTLNCAVDRLSEEGLLLRIARVGTVSTDPQNPPTGLFIEVRTRSGRWETHRTPRRPNVQNIREAIKERIKTGAYPAGSRFPTVRKLAAEFDVPMATIHNALEPLKESGVLACTDIARHGTRVHQSAISLLKEKAE
ncbi:GntR family transcriptional regulator [Streptomyces sp. NPDC001073]